MCEMPYLASVDGNIIAPHFPLRVDHIVPVARNVPSRDFVIFALSGWNVHHAKGVNNCKLIVAGRERRSLLCELSATSVSHLVNIRKDALRYSHLRHPSWPKQGPALNQSPTSSDHFPRLRLTPPRRGLAVWTGSTKPVNLGSMLARKHLNGKENKKKVPPF